MRSRPPWREELWSVGLILGTLFLFGRISGLAPWPFFAGIAGYLGWNVYHMALLFRWLDRPKTGLPDDTPGLWGHIYYRLLIRQRNEKNRKKQIKRLLKEFSTSAHALPDATVVLNDRHEILWANEAATQLLSIRRSDTGQRIVDLIRHPDFRNYLSEADYDQPLALSAPKQPDQALLLRVVPYGRQQYLLLARDITERQRLEQMRRDFVSNASHELKTPLTVLQGSLDQLESIDSDNPSMLKPLEWMRRQSDRMQRILEDLLTLARLEGTSANRDMQQVLFPDRLLSTICEDAQALSRDLGGHRFDIRTDETLAILGDESHFQAVLSNLVMNAVHYTPAGGKITVRWERTPAGARFSVRDTGPGIAPQHLSRLTERFYRVDVSRSRETGGTGLGLAIVKHVLEQYGSNLEVQSEPGQGSCFSFIIPVEYIMSEARAS